MKNVVDIFQTLGNNIRFKILKLLIDNNKKNPESSGLCVCELIKACKTANSTMTHHLDWLRSAGLVKSERRGQWIYYNVNKEVIKELKEFVKNEL